MTHWNLPSFTLLSAFGTKSSLGTSVAFDRSMLSPASSDDLIADKFESSSKANGSASPPWDFLDLAGRGVAGCVIEARRFRNEPEVLFVASTAAGTEACRGTEGMGREAGASPITETALSGSVSSLVRSTIPPPVRAATLGVLLVGAYGMVLCVPNGLDGSKGRLAVVGAGGGGGGEEGSESGGRDGEEKSVVARARR